MRRLAENRIVRTTFITHYHQRRFLSDIDRAVARQLVTLAATCRLDDDIHGQFKKMNTTMPNTPGDAAAKSIPASQLATRRDFVVTGRLLRIAQVPEAREDYLDVNDPAAIIDQLRSDPSPPDLLTFWQRLPDSVPKFDYPYEWDNVAALRVTSFDDWTRNQVHASVRTKLRKAQKLGLRVDLAPFDDDLVRGIAEIFNETPIRQGRPYEHFGKSPSQIAVEWSIDAESSVFVAARVQEELIGFVKLTSTDRYSEMSGTICKLAHRDKPAMSALIGRSVQYCEAMGIPWLTYGRYHYGRKGDDSLSEFKKHNGFRKVELPRYYVPLSLRGRVGFKLGLHHRLSERLPTRVVQVLVQLRARFYAMASHAARPTGGPR